MEAPILGELFARAHELLSEHYAGRSATLRTAALVLEVDTDEEACVLVTATDDRLWVQRAFLDEAFVRLDREIERQEATVDDDD